VSRRRLLVTGGSGYLGGELVRRAGAAGWDVVGTCFRGRGDVRLDVRDRAAVDAVWAEVRPDAVINTAYLQAGPDAWATNADGAANVAAACARAGVRLVHVSTDLVFDGRSAPYSEGDPVAPVIDYGRSKAAAERAVADADPGAAVVRTSLIYGGEEHSVHERRILDVADARADLAFFTDELRCPVRATDLAEALLAIASSDVAGPLHLAGADGVSRYELACLVAEANGRPSGRLRAAASAEVAPHRPRDCRLDCSLARERLGIELPGVRAVLGGRAAG
jgi:dTDP-4-dehydrorhamnose reductase